MSILSAYPGIAALQAARKHNHFSYTELLHECLERSRKLKEQLNCYISLDESESLVSQARALDQRWSHGEDLPALAGLPITCKDNILSQALPTTCASRMLADFKPPHDAFALARMRNAGCLNLGKTNMDEFAMGSTTETSYFGPARNPWNADYVPGGSSGGSAAAVAAQGVVCALGTDTGGSVRQPAAFCGVTGFKPSYGAISRRGIVAYASSLDQVGVLARSAEDVAWCFNALSAHDAYDATSSNQAREDATALLHEPCDGLRLGVVSAFFNHPSLSEPVGKCLEQALRTLEQSCGCRRVDSEIPSFELALSAYYLIATAEAYSNLCRYDGIRYGLHAQADHLADLYRVTPAVGFGEEVNARIQLGKTMLSQENFNDHYLQALKVRHKLAHDFMQAFRHCDLIAAPVHPQAVFKLHTMMDNSAALSATDLFTIPINMAGLPALSLPCGFAEDLPVGIQLIAPYWGEKKLLQAAHQMQLHSDWHQAAGQRIAI